MFIEHYGNGTAIYAESLLPHLLEQDVLFFAMMIIVSEIPDEIQYLFENIRRHVFTILQFLRCQFQQHEHLFNSPVIFLQSICCKHLALFPPAVISDPTINNTGFNLFYYDKNHMKLNKSKQR